MTPIASSPSQLETGGPVLTINDGSAQRSMIWSLTVTFASPVTLATGAITLTEVGVGAIALDVTNPSSDGKTYVITFSGSEIIGGSLPNGAHDLTIHSSLVTVNSTGLAMSGPDQTFSFYRLFGDIAGSGIVNGVGYSTLVAAFDMHAGQAGYVAALDYTGQGINGVAYTELVGSFDRTQSALATTDLYYSDRGQVIEEQQSGATTTQYVWGPFYFNQLVERDDENDGSGNLTRRLYVEQDANFNVTSLTDASGNVVERYVYDPYGTVTVENPDGSVKGNGTIASSSYGMVYLFQGGRIDPATGLYLFGARDYDPATGRWDEEDPAGYINGASRYQFVESNPTSALDPSGLGLLSYLYTGDWNASDDVYAAATEGGGDAYIENAGFAHNGLSALSQVPGAGRLAALTNQGLSALEGGNLHNMVMNPKAAAAALNNAKGSAGGPAAANAPKAGPATPSGDETTPTTEGDDDDDYDDLDAQTTYQTYTKTHPDTGQVYSGRTSGTGTPFENVDARDANHHMNDEGYGPAVLDKSSSDPDAIRGREQDLIWQNGGAQSEGGTSGNKINGISEDNPNMSTYMEASENEFPIGASE